MGSLRFQVVLLAGISLLPAIGQAVYYRNIASWNSPVRQGEQVALPEAEAWGGSVLWVDARHDDQFEQEHVPGALLLNEDRWDELLPQVLAAWSPDKRIVAYCSSESCGASREVARRLREQAQLKNVFVLEGGWEEWRRHRK